jgi:hypothetical protein
MESNALVIMRLCGWAAQVLPHQAAGHLASLVPQPQLPRARGALPSCLSVHPDTSAVDAEALGECCHKAHSGLIHFHAGA